MEMSRPHGPDESAVAFTVGVEVLSHIVAAGARPTDEQIGLLLAHADFTFTPIGLELASRLLPDPDCPVSLADKIVAAECERCLAIRRLSCQAHQSNRDIELEMDERCERLARVIPLVADEVLAGLGDSLSALVETFVDLDSTMDPAPLALVLAALIARPSGAFAAPIRDLIVPPEAATSDDLLDSWPNEAEGMMAEVLLALIAAHPGAIAAHQALIISGVLLERGWGEYDLGALSRVVDLLSGFMHFGLIDAAVMEAVRTWSGPSDDNDANLKERTHLRIRLLAFAFLALRAPAIEFVTAWIADRSEHPVALLERWIVLVNDGWFSTEYLGRLTLRAMPPMVGQELPDWIFVGLRNLAQGMIAEHIVPENRMLFQQPPQMAAWLDVYGTE
jgi:hypothetical protein